MLRKCLSLVILGVFFVSTNVSAVETDNPETNYTPSFEGQTRIDAITTEAAYAVNIIVNNLESPWGMDELPDGRILITQKNGTLVIVNPSEGSVSLPIDGLPEVNSSGQGGLLDVLVSPDFLDTRAIYFTFSEQLNEGSLTSVGYGELSEDEVRLENIKVIFQALPAYEGTNHYGSRIAMDQAGNLFVTTGERSDRGIREQAQDLDSYLGKVLHITQEGDPVNSEMKGVYTYGHRNVQGLAIHPETGDVWISEMGPRGGDELNLLVEGNNYGWPLVSYGIEYTGEAINQGETSGESFTEPVYYWDPVLAPSGMAFYTGETMEEWVNNLFIGGLAGSHIARLVIEDQRVVGEERLLAEEGERFRDVLSHSTGDLYAITDSGLLYQIQGQ